MTEKKTRTKTEIAIKSFFYWMLSYMNALYGNAHTEWWREEGCKAFLKWAKKRGLEYCRFYGDKIPVRTQTKTREYDKIVSEALKNSVYKYEQDAPKNMGYFINTKYRKGNP